MAPRTAVLPDADFHRIRPYGSPASRANGFEELASLLVRGPLFDWPEGTAFHRFGNPDGGREGKGVLPNGDVWAWQAKYLFEFRDGEAGQVAESVRRVLDTEPNLTRYFVALPYDLPAGDVDRGRVKRKSAHTRWSEKKTTWEALAAERGMSVEFVYVGAHDLVSELTKPEHTGTLRYWFDASVLSPDALNQRLDDVVTKAGRRYTPRAHVEVDAVVALEGLGRSPAYLRTIQLALAAVRSSRSNTWSIPAGEEGVFADEVEACREMLLEVDVAIQAFLDAAMTSGPLPEPPDAVDDAQARIRVIDGLLQERHLKDGRYYVNEAASLHDTTGKAREALWQCRSLLLSAETQAARAGRLLMTGRAGMGKTHLFCDVASSRIEAGLPTLVMLGQDFDSRSLLPQIGEHVGLEGTLDDVLGVLDAAGEASGCLAMLMIDALNESTDAERWIDDLRVLSGAVDRHPNVVLAVSCRTEFVTPVAGDAEGFPRVAHVGFSEATAEAVDRYTAEYNLERLSFPVLNPEFGNPLFLKLACEALSTLGEGRFTLGTAGLTMVSNAFLEAVNKRLAAPTRCDYDGSTDLVLAVSRELAASGPGPYDRAEAKRITEALHPEQAWSKSLLYGLLREGVLAETHDRKVVFGYQRLGDVLRAQLLAEKSAEELRDWWWALEPKRWEERGTIGALAVIAPEALGEEIVDLFREEDDYVEADVIDAFVESLVLRAPAHTTDRTARIVAQLIEFPEWTERIWEQLVRVACVPGHRTNAVWTHELLSSRSLPARDVTWSEWLIGATDRGNDNAVKALLDWGWHPQKSAHDAAPVPDEIARLATLVLGWMLTTTDRRVRDRATKALVSVGERSPAGFASAVGQFRACDDPYVVERIAAALCGVGLRSADPMSVLTVADAAVDLVGDSWPEHLLTRDYLRRTAAAARSYGWTGPDWLPPYGSEWPVDAMSSEEITALDEEPGYKHSSVLGSLDGQFGDFGRYVVGAALEHFDHPDSSDLHEVVRRVVFTRVQELGWSPKVHGALDRGRRGGHDGPVERYGKKYQWIGFYEVLGRLADTHLLKERWDEDVEPFRYQYAEQLVWRDIDPTVLTPGGLPDRVDEPAWFAPVHARFPDTVVSAYPTDLSGVPDPLDLVTLTDPGGTAWLSLIRHANWAQELSPEVEALKVPNLSVWMQIRGYLVPSEQVDALRSWAAGQDWDGRWMSENAEVHSRLLGAHPGSPDWDWADGNAEPRRYGQEEAPAALFQPLAWYGGTGTSRESAGVHEPRGFVPSRMLFDLLGLRHGNDFRWDDAGGLAVTDPTAGVDEASTLVMRRDLTANLQAAGYSLFWTVLLNKQRLDHKHGFPGDDYRWVSASASYVMSGEVVECISGKASLRSPGPDGDQEPVEWTLRSSG